MASPGAEGVDEGVGGKGFPPRAGGSRGVAPRGITAYHEAITTNRGAVPDAPGSSLSFVLFLAASAQASAGSRSGTSMSSARAASTVSESFCFLEPDKLGFQVPYSLLEAAHLGNHAGIGTADVAE